MVITALAGAVVGAALALRFKVLILLPATVIGIFSVTVLGAAQGGGLRWICLAAASICAGLQAGYFFGGIALLAVLAARPKIEVLLRSLLGDRSARL